MAITYNVAKCRKGWGVYVRAISGDDLKALSPSTKSLVERVTSGRLARKRSKQSAKNYISRLKSLSSEEQRGLIRSVWIKIAPHDFKVVTVQDLKLYRELRSGAIVPTITTVNRAYAENLALYYAEQGLESFLRKGATHHIKLPLNTPTDNLNLK